MQIGKVDKVQGRQAVVAVLSMTASTIRDIPRGMSFLLSRHRLNIAVSRALWATLVLRSPAVTDSRPPCRTCSTSGAFLRLTGPKHGDQRSHPAALAADLGDLDIVRLTLRTVPLLPCPPVIVDVQEADRGGEDPFPRIPCGTEGDVDGLRCAHEPSKRVLSQCQDLGFPVAKNAATSSIVN